MIHRKLGWKVESFFTITIAKEARRFRLGKEQQEVFDKIKQVLVSQRALLRASEGEAHGCAFQRRKDARSRHQRLFVENVEKTEGNRSK